MENKSSQSLYPFPAAAGKGREKPERILVIRLGALGDLILCFQGFHEIRQAHPNAEIAFLTMPAFADFARSMPWFNQVIVDERPSIWQLDKWFDLIRRVYAFAPTRVYDLQGKFRQSVLYALLGGPLGREWSGAAPLCSHPRLWPPKPDMHYIDFVTAQLRRADVPPKPAIDLAWMTAPLDGVLLPDRYAVLIPGCAPGRDYKRWPTANYASLADQLRNKGITSIAVGTKTDVSAITAIQALAPHLIDLSGRTSLPQLANLMRQSVCVVGNDTGPTHLAAAVGAPTLALMSNLVNATWSAPRGPRARWLQGKPLADLGTDKVLLALADLLDRNS